MVLKNGNIKSWFGVRQSFLITLFLLAPALLSAQSGSDTTAARLKLLFIGDIMGHDGQIASALNDSTGTYDYSEVFKYISPVIREADLAIANLEVTLAGRPYKGYPQFSSPASLPAAAHDAGIDMMVTANNHSADRGLSGITNTIMRLDSLGIAHTGTYRSSAERESLVPYIIEKNQIRLALLNYTYGTNGLPVPPPAIVDLIDRRVIADDIRASKEAGTDGIIVFIHWGTEYDTLPSASQTELAEWMLEQGVDLVIGSHPHVIQPMELRKGDGGRDRLIVYSMGNFVSNQRRRYTDGGAMVSVTVTKGEEGLKIEEAGYILTWVYLPVVKGRPVYHIMPAAADESWQKVRGNGGSAEKMRLFINDSRRIFGRYNLGVEEIVPVVTRKEDK
jgi:poly-gamma-glutamate capsule biosynthesis protein CapA/YwtB (metallophosphatase superfamily)